MPRRTEPEIRGVQRRATASVGIGSQLYQASNLQVGCSTHPGRAKRDGHFGVARVSSGTPDCALRE